MKTTTIFPLGTALKDFLTHELPELRGMSSHTILSYRDSLKLLLQFLARRQSQDVAALRLEETQPADIEAFLEDLEGSRKNSVATRNIRLAALHGFFRYLAGRWPQCLEQAQRILAIPFKRSCSRTVQYLEFEEVQAILGCIDRTCRDGRRDGAMLTLMFNTGMRVQEIVDLRVCDLQLSRPFSIRIFGKGRKERVCPIWPETAQWLRDYLEERGVDPRGAASVFVNHRGQPLTRFGIRYLLAKYLRQACVQHPLLGRKRIHPHSIRHSTAVHLLKSGVDLSTIANWLGHASVNTTNRYATMDLEMKRQALEKMEPLSKTPERSKNWQNDADLIAWLESL